MNIQIRIQTQHTKQKLHTLQCKDNDKHPLMHFYIYKHIYNYKNASTTRTRNQIFTRVNKKKNRNIKTNMNIRQTYTKTKRMTWAWEKRFEDRYWYRKRNQHPHTWTSTFACTITHPKRTSETQEERETQSVNICRSQFSIVLRLGNIGDHESPPLKTNWTNSRNCFQNTLRG